MDTRKIAMTYANLCVSLVIVTYLSKTLSAGFFLLCLEGSLGRSDKGSNGHVVDVDLLPRLYQRQQSATAGNRVRYCGIFSRRSRAVRYAQKRCYCIKEESLHIFYWVRMMIVVTTRVIAVRKGRGVECSN